MPLLCIKSPIGIIYDKLQRIICVFYTNLLLSFFFFLNDPATTEISPFPPPAPLPIGARRVGGKPGANLISAETFFVCGWCRGGEGRPVFSQPASPPPPPPPPPLPSAPSLPSAPPL